jgi:hypothetical protein
MNIGIIQKKNKYLFSIDLTIKIVSLFSSHELYEISLSENRIFFGGGRGVSETTTDTHGDIREIERRTKWYIPNDNNNVGFFQFYYHRRRCW